LDTEAERCHIAAQQVMKDWAVGHWGRKVPHCCTAGHERLGSWTLGQEGATLLHSGDERLGSWTLRQEGATLLHSGS